MIGVSIYDNNSQFDLNKLKLALIHKHFEATSTTKLSEPSLLKKFTDGNDRIKNHNFFSFDAAAVAQQLTLLEYSIFKQVGYEEFYSLKVNTNPSLNKNSVNLTLLINRSNSISYWVATNILAQTSNQTRAKAIMRFIIIAHCCNQLGNYNSLEAILGGFRLNQIDRLRKDWGIKGGCLALLSELEHIMSPANNYSNYRKILSKRKDLLKDHHPTLPYLGVFLKDLTFIEDGNPDTFSNKNLNISKITMLSNTIKIIRAFQLTSFNNVIKDKNIVLLRYLAHLPRWPKPSWKEYLNLLNHVS